MSYKLLAKYNFIVIPSLMILSLIALIKSPYFTSEISPYVVLDFLITIPLIYFLLIRRRNINRITVVSTFVLGLVTASIFLPTSEQQMVVVVKNYFLLFLELGILLYVINKARLIYNNFRKLGNSVDFYEAITYSCKTILPSRAASFLGTEITVLYYTFFKWRFKELKKDEYSYTKEGSYNGVFLGLFLILMIETFVLHVLIVKTSVVLAWVLTILSIYTLLQLFAVWKSLYACPVCIDRAQKTIKLRFGFTGNIMLKVEDIESIVIHSSDFPEKNNVKYLSFLGAISGHNIIVNLKENITFEKIYGIKEETKSLAILIDDKESFKSVVENLKI